ncbi:MAG TPA: single-stranded DNA-binding protein [Nitrospirota bacterium]|nr:single-stranded DNA-binding protein [Nitrospirota bacterium]
MTSFNKVILLGNLTRDPEVKNIPSGTTVASFGLAVNRKYKQGEETKEEVSFFDIVVFGKQANNCSQYLHKGDAVMIDGRLQQRRWDDKESGQKRSKIDVVAESVKFMPKRGSNGSATGGGHQEAPEFEASAGDNEVPF